MKENGRHETSRSWLRASKRDSKIAAIFAGLDSAPIRSASIQDLSNKSIQGAEVTDRELLEAAAKAAGIELLDRPDVHAYAAGLMVQGGVWSPLTDDGDALRLAVDLGLVVDTSRPSAALPFRIRAYAQNDFEDQRAATRRAIVHAAAAIASP